MVDSKQAAPLHSPLELCRFLYWEDLVNNFVGIEPSQWARIICVSKLCV